MSARLRERIQAELANPAGAGIINLVNDLITYAQAVRSSDVHMDPVENTFRVRFRIDGVLQEVFTFPKKIHPEIISRIKILSALRTDEHQAAQDGRFRLKIENGPPVDVRVSIIPTYFGENAVLRLLSDKTENFTLRALDFSRSNEEKILRSIKKPYGMILATGPTGSGKTTTLYTILKMLNTPEISIITIEDPIEYAVDSIEQIQVNSRTGLTFAQGLRSILRQDPNIIMVGEIRDSETAGIATNVALTGHLLLSTIHTNDPATTLPRLLDMGIEAYLIASTVNIAIGQRLLRRICKNCLREKKFTNVELKSLNEIIPEPTFKNYKTFYEGSGCADCNNTGYSGRVPIHEVLEVDANIRAAILKKASASQIKEIAVNNGMVPMGQDGLNKAAEGLTTVSEVLRITHE